MENHDRDCLPKHMSANTSELLGEKEQLLRGTASSDRCRVHHYTWSNNGTSQAAHDCLSLPIHHSDASNKSAKRKLQIAICLCFLFFLVELVAGLWAGSLAILSDSFHLLSDVAGFAISLAAIYLSSQPATRQHTWGFHRAEIIGAIMSTFLIWILTVGLVYEAIGRIKNPQPINGKIMFFTALAGVFVNIVLGLTLHEHHHHHHHEDSSEELGSSPDQSASPTQGNHHHHEGNINLASATIHVLGDLLFSVGVLISSLIIWHKPEYTIIDPICTFFFSFIVLLTTVRIMSRSISVLMEATPSNVDIDAIIRDLRSIDGVQDVHDIHVWNITIGKSAIAIHLDLHPYKTATNECFDFRDYDKVLSQAQDILAFKHRILHATIQIDIIHDIETFVPSNPGTPERNGTPEGVLVDIV